MNREYKEIKLNTAMLEIPRESYQRDLSPARVQKIVKGFDEKIANEPKVSNRDGKYYVFDGQHTIAARKIMNGGEDLDILCKVYFGMSEKDEANLFAQQTGASAPLSAGTKLRALVFSEDPEALAFKAATEALGFNFDYSMRRGFRRIGCINTAFDLYRKIGEERYKESLFILLSAWDGDMESLRGETLQGICRFIDLYHDEYDKKRLIKQLQKVDPLTIYREGKAMGVSMAGSTKYLYQVYRIYNGKSNKLSLPLKF